MDVSRRRLLAGVAASGAIGTAGCLGGGGGGSCNGCDDVEATPPEGPIPSAPLPENPGEYTYAAMGRADAPTVTYFGSWKCPVCAEFATGSDRALSLGEIVEDYVSEGVIQLEYRCLGYTSSGPFLGPDAPRAARAGLAVWNVDPGAYWAYHELIMQNQPPEAEEWATASRLERFACQAGVEGGEDVCQQVTDGQYDSTVRDTTDAATDAGVTGTPTLVANGQTASPYDEAAARSLIESL